MNKSVRKSFNDRYKDFIQFCKDNNNIMTNIARIDGLGEQVKIIIFSILFAKVHGLTYVHTPIQSMEHNYNNDVSFIEDINNALSSITRIYPTNYNKNLQRRHGLDDSGIVNDFAFANIAYYEKMQEYKDIMSEYRNSINYEDYFDKNFYNIAVHIRRSNSQDTSRGRNALLEYQMKLYTDDFYIVYIEELYKTIMKSSNKILIHIYSQEIDIERYKKLNETLKCLVFHLGSPLIETFNSMVIADLLVTGASTLSYAAALLRPSNTIYHKYLHTPMPGWTIA
jgi:hypothetical protein